MTHIDRIQKGIIFRAVVDSCMHYPFLEKREKLDIIDSSYIAQKVIDNIEKTQDEDTQYITRNMVEKSTSNYTPRL